MGKVEHIIWDLPLYKPNKNGFVISEFLDGEYVIEYIVADRFDKWNDDIIKWGYLDIKEIDPERCEEVDREEEYRIEIEKLKKEIDGLKRDNKYFNVFNNYLLDRATRNSTERCAKFSTGDTGNSCWGGNDTNGDLLKHSFNYTRTNSSNDTGNARPIGEISIDELGKIFYRLMSEELRRDL